MTAHCIENFAQTRAFRCVAACWAGHVSGNATETFATTPCRGRATWTATSRPHGPGSCVARVNGTETAACAGAARLWPCRATASARAAIETAWPESRTDATATETATATSPSTASGRCGSAGCRAASRNKCCSGARVGYLLYAAARRAAAAANPGRAPQAARAAGSSRGKQPIAGCGTRGGASRRQCLRPALVGGSVAVSGRASADVCDPAPGFGGGVAPRDCAGAGHPAPRSGPFLGLLPLRGALPGAISPYTGRKRQYSLTLAARSPRNRAVACSPLSSTPARCPWRSTSFAALPSSAATARSGARVRSHRGCARTSHLTPPPAGRQGGDTHASPAGWAALFAADAGRPPVLWRVRLLTGMASAREASRDPPPHPGRSFPARRGRARPRPSSTHCSMAALSPSYTVRGRMPSLGHSEGGDSRVRPSRGRFRPAAAAARGGLCLCGLRRQRGDEDAGAGVGRAAGQGACRRGAQGDCGAGPPPGCVWSPPLRLPPCMFGPPVVAHSGPRLLTRTSPYTHARQSCCSSECAFAARVRCKAQCARFSPTGRSAATATTACACSAPPLPRAASAAPSASRCAASTSRERGTRGRASCGKYTLRVAAHTSPAVAARMMARSHPALLCPLLSLAQASTLVRWVRWRRRRRDWVEAWLDDCAERQEEEIAAVRAEGNARAQLRVERRGLRAAAEADDPAAAASLARLNAAVAVQAVWRGCVARRHAALKRRAVLMCVRWSCRSVAPQWSHPPSLPPCSSQHTGRDAGRAWPSARRVEAGVHKASAAAEAAPALGPAAAAAAGAWGDP